MRNLKTSSKMILSKNDSQILKKRITNYKQQIKKKTQPVFVINRIVDRKIIKNKIYYKVRWQGYSSKSDTWEPYINLKMDKVQELINDYEEKQGQKFKKTYDEQRPKLKSERLHNKQAQMTSSYQIDSDNEYQQVGQKPQNIINKKYNSQKKPCFDLHQQYTQNIQDQDQTIQDQTIQEQTIQEQTINEQTLQEQSNQDQTNNDQTNQDRDSEEYYCHLGSFKNNDKIQSIITLKKDEFLDDILFQVQWEPRQNGYQPEPTWIQNNHLKKKLPQLVFEFYETRIKFIEN